MALVPDDVRHPVLIEIDIGVPLLAAERQAHLGEGLGDFLGGGGPGDYLQRQGRICLPV